MRVLVIGNSHVSTVKMALDAGAGRDSQMKFDFAALNGSDITGFDIVGDAIVVSPQHEQTLARTYPHGPTIPLGNYDFFVVAAGANRLDPRLYFNESKVVPLARDLISTIVHETGLTPPIYSKLRRAVDSLNRIVFLGAPLCSPNNEAPNTVPHFESETEWADAARLIATIRDICDESIGNRESVSVILPPTEILTASGFNTLNEFMNCGVNPNEAAGIPMGPGRLADTTHGNSEYGIRIFPILERALEQLGA